MEGSAHPSSISSHGFDAAYGAPYQAGLAVEGWELSHLLRGLLGLFVLISLSWLLSADRKSIRWSLVGKALAIQLAFAVLILHWPPAARAFDGLSKAFVWVLSFSGEGARFVFGDLALERGNLGYVFAFQVLPTIVFFSALTSLLFYFGLLQSIVSLFARALRKLLGLSGAESLSAVGNIFLGQTEAPLLVKPYLATMSRSELFCVMTGGMATIAGGVLAAFVGFLGGDDPLQQALFAKHLLSASVMSAPAAILSAKMMIPERGAAPSTDRIDGSSFGVNALEALSAGTAQGLMLAVNVGAMLLVFVALIGMLNSLLGDVLGEWLGLNERIAVLSGGRYASLSFEALLGGLLAPLAWLLGVDWVDAAYVGQLLGEKTVLNEFVAYVSLAELKEQGAFSSLRSVLIATYALCGFANFASIGIQIGGIGVLAPSRRSELASLGFRALIAGTFASLFTAVVVGMVV
jgi:CNT family concentrative nucleoside transporter